MYTRTGSVEEVEIFFSKIDKKGSMDHTQKLKPNQSAPALIPLDRPRMY